MNNCSDVHLRGEILWLGAGIAVGVVFVAAFFYWCGFIFVDSQIVNISSCQPIQNPLSGTIDSFQITSDSGNYVLPNGDPWVCFPKGSAWGDLPEGSIKGIKIVKFDAQYKIETRTGDSRAFRMALIP